MIFSLIVSYNVLFFTENNLIKTRLVPTMDFFYQYEKRATDWMINIIPQWRRAYIFVWFRIERLIRDYAKEVNVTVEVYSGVYDIMEVVNVVNDTKQLFYLDHVDKRFPVPNIIWKAIYDSKNKAALAFLVLNDPFSPLAPEYSHICPDVFYELAVALPRTKHGYVFACDIEDLRKHLPFLPKWNIERILRISNNKQNKIRRWN